MGNVYWNHRLSFNVIMFVIIVVTVFCNLSDVRILIVFPSHLDAVEETSLVLQNVSL